MAHVGTNGAWLRVNRRLCEIVGYPEDELTAIAFQDITHPDDLDADLHLFEPMMRGELPGDGYQMEKRYHRKDGALIWVNLTTSLQRNQAGAPLFCISVIEDVTQRKRDEAHLRTLTGELNHRVKNTLAIVQSIATRSFPDGRSVAEGREDLGRRLQALAAAHSLLTDEAWVGARVGDVVEAAIAPYRAAEAEACTVSGPEVWLPARVAVSLAMAVGELATNATKHGAFSVPEGRVAVRWTREEREGGEAICALSWTERGGPPVTPPERDGFGMTLIRRLLPSESGGEAEIRFEPQGVEVRMSFAAGREDAPISG